MYTTRVEYEMKSHKYYYLLKLFIKFVLGHLPKFLWCALDKYCNFQSQTSFSLILRL